VPRVNWVVKCSSGGGGSGAEWCSNKSWLSGGGGPCEEGIEEAGVKGGPIATVGINDCCMEKCKDRCRSEDIF